MRRQTAGSYIGGRFDEWYWRDCVTCRRYVCPHCTVARGNNGVWVDLIRFDLFATKGVFAPAHCALPVGLSVLVMPLKVTRNKFELALYFHLTAPGEVKTWSRQRLFRISIRCSPAVSAKPCYNVRHIIQK